MNTFNGQHDLKERLSALAAAAPGSPPTASHIRLSAQRRPRPRALALAMGGTLAVFVGVLVGVTQLATSDTPSAESHRLSAGTSPSGFGPMCPGTPTLAIGGKKLQSADGVPEREQERKSFDKRKDLLAEANFVSKGLVGRDVTLLLLSGSELPTLTNGEPDASRVVARAEAAGTSGNGKFKRLSLSGKALLPGDYTLLSVWSLESKSKSCDANGAIFNTSSVAITLR